MVTRLFVGIFTPAIRATLDSPVSPASDPDLQLPLGAEIRASGAKPPYGVAPERGTIGPAAQESTKTYQLCVNYTTSLSNRPERGVDLAGNLIDVGHAIHRAQDAGRRIVRDDRRGLPMIGLQPCRNRLPVIIRAA